jgi:inner membrane protein
MLAINHVTLATAGTIGISVYLDKPFFLPFIIFVVFASLLPDVDHPGSEVSNYLPFVSKFFKHRGITHSIFGVTIFSSILYLLLKNYNQIFSIFLLAIALIGVQYLGKLFRKRINQIQDISNDFFSKKQLQLAIKWFIWILDLFLIALIFLIWKEQFRKEIIILLIVGYIAHIVGDFVTKDGIPLFWPIKSRQGLKLFRTGSVIESIIGFVLFIANIYLLSLFWQKFGLSGQDYWQNYLDFKFL